MRRILFFLLLMVSVSRAAFAQTDPGSIEAMIKNHKMVAFAMDLCVTTEIGLTMAHESTKKDVNKYRKVEESLDKYQRSFDILNAIFQGASTAIRTVDVLGRSKNNIENFAKLLDHYQKNFLTKLDVEESDTIILRICSDCIKDLRKCVPGLLNSYWMIPTYFTGVTECTTANLMDTFQSINGSLEDLDYTLSRAYSRLWYYMMMRSYYYKKELYRSASIKDILDGAFGSWMQSARDVGVAIRNRTDIEHHRRLGGCGLLGERRRQQN